MQLAGYEILQGKHLSFLAPEQKSFTYMKSLGSYYSEENVRIRLAKNRSKVKTPKHLSREAQQHISDVDASVKAVDPKIAQLNSELSTQKLIQKHCASYRLCRKVIEDCKSAKNPKAYRSKHQAVYKLHDSLKKELQDRKSSI